MNDINDIIEDLLKIYLTGIDAYNSKIYQTVNDKYTIIDKSMLTVYLFVKIIEERNEKNKEITDCLANYLIKQYIYGETGNLSFEILDKTKAETYNKILDELITEKFKYKNRLMKKLKYEYTGIVLNEYSELLIFLENIADFAIFQKMILRGNSEVQKNINDTKNKIINQLDKLNINELFYNEKKKLIELIKYNQFFDSEYGKLMEVALNLKDVYRYSMITTQIPENVLFHQYTVTACSIIFSKYANRELGENIDLYSIMIKSLFHDFSEYKGTEIVTQFKNYNDITKKMFKEIESEDEKDLEIKIGKTLFNIILNYKDGAEGIISDLIDKMLAIMKLWIEVEYFHNYTFIKTANSVFQDRFKRFLRFNDINSLKNKKFYLELLREYYIYIKENLIEKDIKCFLSYFTEEELEEFRNEIKLLKDKPETFLK